MTPSNREPIEARPGVGVDSEGQPVIDPTNNVLLLVEASARRQDDLRHMRAQWMDAEIAHLKEMAQLRADHSKEMKELDRDRLEKIREVDVAATKTEADRALTAIQALAAKATTDADNIRTALNATAATIAKQTSDTVGEITTRIAALEKANYEGQGRSKVADPAMAELVNEMKSLRGSRDTGQGERRGISLVAAVIMGAVGLIATLLTIGSIMLSAKGGTP